MLSTFWQTFIAQVEVEHWRIICYWQILSGTFEFGSTGHLSSQFIQTFMIDYEPKTDLLAMVANPETQIFNSTEKP